MDNGSSSSESSSVTERESDSTRCPVSGLNQRETQVLKRSWKKLRGVSDKDLRVAGISVVLWMFDHVPGMRFRFTKFSPRLSPDELIGNEKFVNHTQSLIKSLNFIVSVSDDSQELDKMFRSVIRIHLMQTPVVGSKYFQEFADQFHLYVERHLNVRSDSEESRLWTVFLNSFVRVMEEEEREHAIAERHKKQKCCSIL